MKITDLFMMIAVLWACFNTAGAVQYVIIGCAAVYAVARLLKRW